jgi:hypothetical protein
MLRFARPFAVSSFGLVLALIGCEEIPDTGTGGGGAEDGAGGQGGVGDPFDGGVSIDVPVGEERVYVDLDEPAIVDEAADWDVAFEGVDVFTNGGVSGSGQGSAFGPNSAPMFLSDEIPEVPFLIEDRAGGAFLDWYDYDNEIHALWSRFHVYGVRRGGELYKLQILGYYGEVQGAPVSGLYKLRIAHVTDTGPEATEIIDQIDATAGGPSGTDADPGACIVLATGEILPLTPDEALASEAWDICLRRDVISVNGGSGGPGDVEAVNFQGADIPTETIEDVRERTEDSELGKFDAVGYAELTDPALAWRGDGIVTAFTNKWLEPGVEPIAPAVITWFVVGSDGSSPFYIAFTEFVDAAATNPGTIKLRVKRLNGSL